MYACGTAVYSGTVSASELQTQMMSVQMESTTLKELFDLIEEKFNYTFLIRNNDINLNERTSQSTCRTARSTEILTTALKNQHADFVVNNNRIVVYKSSSNPNELRNTERMQQQTITISGTIVDAVTASR